MSYYHEIRITNFIYQKIAYLNQFHEINIKSLFFENEKSTEKMESLWSEMHPFLFKKSNNCENGYYLPIDWVRDP